MIHGSSNDPVLIKKIALKIWRLRDELEAVIEERIKNMPEGENRPNLDDLYIEYKTQGHVGDSTTQEMSLKDASELDDSGEAEMLAAMQGGSDEEEAPEAESVTTGDRPQLKIITSPETTDDGNVIIRQRSPLLPENKIYKGRTILAEINMNEMYFFASENFLVGQSVVLEFLIPKKFIVNADIIYCRTFNMKSRIISQNKMPFRVGVKFTFLKEGERTLLRQFVESIEPDVPAPVEKESSSGGDGDEDLFEGLDDMEI